MERSKPDMESNSPKLFSDEDWRRIAGANLLLDGEGENDEIAIAEIEQAAHAGDLRARRLELLDIVNPKRMIRIVCSQLRVWRI